MHQEKDTPRSTVGPMLLTFLAGAALGAVVTALATPRSGPELRGGLGAFGRRARTRAGAMADQAGAAWNDIKERTGMAAEDLKRGVTDSVNDLRG